MTLSMLGVNGLKTIAKGYLHDVDLEPIDKAWELAVKVHTDKKHFSGELYLEHVLEVASTLASMHLDLDTVLAGLLHGVLEEGITFEQLGKEFGRSVAEIVDGCTRITSVHYNSQLVHHAENVRKMLLAIAADIRVLLVKLADRLQDMCSLETTVPQVIEAVREFEEKAACAGRRAAFRAACGAGPCPRRQDRCLPDHPGTTPAGSFSLSGR